MEKSLKLNGTFDLSDFSMKVDEEPLLRQLRGDYEY